jgi:diacylglycerol kinase (ATP)
MAKKMLMLFNPLAHSGRAGRELGLIQQHAAGLGFHLDTHVASDPAAAQQWLADQDLSACEGVIAAGGDGTLFQTLNGLMQHPEESRPPLGVLPIGTGNAFSRDLGLALGDWRSALDRIGKGKTRSMDIGQVDCKEGRIHFLNIAGMGFVVDAGHSAKKLKGVGQAAYTLGTLWQTLRLKSHTLRMEVDGVELEQENLFVEISNSRYTGTSFLIAPGAAIDDGLLDLTLLEKLSRTRLLRLFPSIYSGRHVEYPEISVIQGRHFRIMEPKAYPMMMDGEFIGSTPAEIRCLPGAVRIFA